MVKRYAFLVTIIAMIVLITAIGCSSETDTSNSAPAKTPAQPADIATATSLDFTVEMEVPLSGTCLYRYRAKNLKTNSIDLRLDTTVVETNKTYVHILKSSTREGWIYTGAIWKAFTADYEDFDEFWNIYYEQFSDCQNYLANSWNGSQNWTYTPHGMGYSLTYTSIDINPNLPDSLFQPD